MRKRFASILIIFMALFSSPIAAQGDAGCTTEKCHADMGTKAFVHGPVGAKICTVCHTEVAGEKHKFTMAAEKEELCFTCHEERRDMMLQDFQHTPVAEGNCVGCHDPHQSDFRYTLKGKASDLCFQCHEKETFQQEFVHGPVGVGDCNACHNPHASENENMLTASPDQICYSCHKELADIPNKRHIHDPVDENCTNCHSPHSNKAKFLLPADPPTLCFECHEEIETFADSGNKHQPTTDGKCLTCHNVHASDNPRMYQAPLTELCFSCHEDMGEYVNEQTHKHGPVKEGDCNACHNPHGSENFRLLHKAFPSEFYQPYATDNYAACFSCHNQDIALDSATSTLTDFRNGDRNLHFLHVNKEVKGRSCKACHQVHASSQDKHIRKSVPFGKSSWELPLAYTKTDNGGSCVVGCHAPKEYSRQ